MTAHKIESYKIESEDEVDAYLKDLFSDPQRRSMDEIIVRANKHIHSKRIRSYFLSKAEKLLSSQGGKT
jgi:hypothetical protein